MPTVYDPSKDPLKATESGRFNPYSHTEEGVATTSPTGAPVIPPKAVPWLTGLVLAAGSALPFLQPNTIAHQVCSWVVTVGAALGLASPGLRRR